MGSPPAMEADVTKGFWGREPTNNAKIDKQLGVQKNPDVRAILILNQRTEAQNNLNARQLVADMRAESERIDWPKPPRY